MKNRPCKKGTVVEFSLTTLRPSVGTMINYHFEGKKCKFHVEHKGMLFEIDAKDCTEVKV